jgi:hypothetical protein
MQMRSKELYIMRQNDRSLFRLPTSSGGEGIKQELKIHCIAGIGTDINGSFSENDIGERNHFSGKAEIINTYIEFLRKKQGVTMLIPNEKISKGEMVEP